MRVVRTVPMTCTDSLACSDALLAKLGHGPALRLKADRPDGTVHGGVTIVHESPHLVCIDLYDDDEPPSPAHRTTFARSAVRPSEEQIDNLLKGGW